MVDYDELVKIIVEYVDIDIGVDIDIEILSEIQTAASDLYKRYDINEMSRSEVEDLVEREVDVVR